MSIIRRSTRVDGNGMEKRFSDSSLLLLFLLVVSEQPYPTLSARDACGPPPGILLSCCSKLGSFAWIREVKRLRQHPAN